MELGGVSKPMSEPATATSHWVLNAGYCGGAALRLLLVIVESPMLPHLKGLPGPQSYKVP